MGRHGKSPAGTRDAHGRKVHGACRLQAGADGGIRSHPLPAHSRSVRSPRRGWPATGVTALLLPSPAHRRVPPPPGARRSALHLAPAPRITCILPRIPHHLHPSPHPAPHAASRRSAAAAPLYKPAAPGGSAGRSPRPCPAPPGSAARRARSGPARSRTHLAGSARLRCAPSAPGAEKEPPPEGRREP